MTPSRTRTISFAALAVAGLFGVAGCAADPAPAESSAPPIAAPSTTPTPEPTRPALDDIVITADGIDYLVVGSPVPEADEATAIAEYDPVYCNVLNGSDREPGTPGAGAWRSVYVDGDDQAFSIKTEEFSDDGKITSITLFNDDVATEAGIRTGATVEELLAAYPEFDEVIDTGLSTIYVIDGEAGKLLFEVAVEDADQPGYWDYRPGAVGTVVWIRSVPRVDTERLSLVATDTIGPCPV
jgi:hypothetical protein